VEDRAQQKRCDPRPTGGTGCSARGHVKRDDHGYRLSRRGAREAGRRDPRAWHFRLVAEAQFWLSQMSRMATSARAPANTTSTAADHCRAERDLLPGAGLSAPLSAAAAPLIGGRNLPLLALGLSSLAVLAPAPNRLGAASHRKRA
jgi:hypothetical protein